MSDRLNRRDFLKLVSILPLLQLNLPHYYGEPDQPAEGGDLPNIVILVFDALSAAQMSLYGYQRETTPNLARFAERATVYHAHHAGGNFTSSGTASLLTGVYPWSHRAIHLHDVVLDRYIKKNIFSAFAQKGYYRSAYSHNLLVTSLLHQFKDDLELFTQTRELCLVDDQFADLIFPEDFNVAFWSEWQFLRGTQSPPSSLFLSLVHRFYRSLHEREILAKYKNLFPKGVPNLHNLYFILEFAIDWIANQLTSMPQPFLAYYHLIPPHEPYLPRRDFVGRFEDGWQPAAKPESPFVRDPLPEDRVNGSRKDYDEYLAYADSEFGRLYEALEGSGRLDNTCFVFTSDHGELFERGIVGHVTPTLYEPIMHVPLMISAPGQKARQDVLAPTSCVDLLPTLLHLAGSPVPDWGEGQVLPNFGGPADPERRIYTIEAKSNPKTAPLTRATVSMVAGRNKLVHYFGYEPGQSIYEMYDLKNDPEELQDIYSARKSTAKEMKEALDQKIRSVNRPI